VPEDEPEPISEPDPAESHIHIGSPPSLADGPLPEHYRPPRRRKKRRGFFFIGIPVVAVLFVGGGAVLFAGLTGKGPAVSLTHDSGIEMCQMLVERSEPVQSASSREHMTVAQYRAVRSRFAGSRYEDIRTTGTHFVDLLWQLDGADEGALLFAGQIFGAYGDLSGACFNHGVLLPRLTDASAAPRLE
jgi:hypothetical protein